uniref:Large Terminase n=1 Tax=Siphoviridae sp. ctgn638 TaxID=2827913 RepID=A0A8S5TLJ8_9CAUD|nr:MAG TPA: Large Terminase [Siphoviridae sp. ctgn638]
MVYANPIVEYNEKIQSGEIVACQKVKTVYKALVRDITDVNSQWVYDEVKANHPIFFIEKFCKHSKGKFANQPVILELWEKAFISALFGIVDKKTGLRRFSEALLIVGKKNGKSLIDSALGLYMLSGDGEGGAECYSAATKRDQAKIVYTEAEKMVKKSPVLKASIKSRVNCLSYDKTDSVFKPLSSDSDTEDGLNIHFAVCDEIHAWKTADLYNIMADGISAREQPLILLSSTAGFVREGLYDLKYDEAINIINGYFDEKGYKDSSLLPVIYELDKKAEWTEPKYWIKANPNLGVSKKYEYLERKVNQAKENPLKQKNVLTKEFNIRETSSEVWLSFDDIDNTEKFDLQELKPKYFIGGSDLSKTTDLTSACALFMLPNDNRIYGESMYWLPADLLESRTKEDKIPYDMWHDMGLLRICNGNKVNYDDVVDWYLELQNEYGIYLYQHGYDSWSSTSFIQKMNDNFGNISVPVIQGKKTLSNPMNMLGAELKSKNIIYNDNPITRWCLTNVRADIDKNENIQPAKTSNPRRRIDGFAAMLNAYVCLIDSKTEYMNLIR